MRSRIVLRIAIGMLAALPFAQAGPPLTTVRDTLFKADGTAFEGVLFIEWKSFEASDTSAIPQQGVAVKVTNGHFRTLLVPTTTALQAAYYVVKYNSDGRTQFSEIWAVPPSAVPVRIRDVRVNRPGTGGPLPPPGNTIVAISDVAGLRTELDSRPARGVLFLPGRAAYINSAGAVESVAGNGSDCVRVDGTAAPCGSATAMSFVDGETPSGAVNGANTQFTLTSTPVAPSALALYRNGLLQRNGADYSLAGAVVTFAAGAVPATGDVLAAWYRVGSNTTTIVFVDGEVPAGAVNGSNASFTVAGAPSPAASLRIYRNGILLKAGADYTLLGSTIVFAGNALPQVGDLLQAWYRR